MQQRAMQLVTTIAGVVFVLLGGYGLLLQEHLEGAIWLILGGELVVLGSANQQRHLAPWRVVAATLFPLIGIVMIIFHLIGWMN